MTKDPIIQIEERDHRYSNAKGAVTMNISQMRKDIQNLLALVRAYEEQINNCDDGAFHEGVERTRAKIFGEGE